MLSSYEQQKNTMLYIVWTITQYGSTVYIRMALVVLKEIPFSLRCTRLLGSLVCRYCQVVTLVKKWVSYKLCLGKVVKKILVVQVVYLTNCSIDKHETW